MTNYRVLASTALLASCLGLAAAPSFAAPSYCGHMETRGDFMQHRAERMEQNHKALLAALKLTPDQEGMWTNLMVSEQPMARVDMPKPDEWAKLTTPERADRMLEGMKERQNHQADHVAAIKAFYAVLTPEQKKVFDDFHSGQRTAKPNPHASGMHRSPPKP